MSKCYLSMVRPFLNSPIPFNRNVFMLLHVIRHPRRCCSQDTRMTLYLWALSSGLSTSGPVTGCIHSQVKHDHLKINPVKPLYLTIGNIYTRKTMFTKTINTVKIDIKSKAFCYMYFYFESNDVDI